MGAGEQEAVGVKRKAWASTALRRALRVRAGGLDSKGMQCGPHMMAGFIGCAGAIAYRQA